jgi:asparagine synthase (glutamine-hydrolysing)
MQGHRGKRILRDVLARYVPPALTDRPKQGFAPPMGEWLRGPLQEWAQGLLSPSSIRELPMLDPTAVTAIWKDHLDRRIDGTPILWSILMLADWRRAFGVTS